MNVYVNNIPRSIFIKIKKNKNKKRSVFLVGFFLIQNKTRSNNIVRKKRPLIFICSFLYYLLFILY